MNINLSIPAKILSKMENSSSLGMFARDTGGCLISKLALSRSNDESREISFAEITESAIFYFSAPALLKLASKPIQRYAKLTPDEVFKPLSELAKLNSEKIKNIKLAKFAQIGTVFSVILPAVFAIAPIRNILTIAETGKEKFISVINLKKDSGKKQSEQAKIKAIEFAQKTAFAIISGLAATAGVLTLAKGKQGYKKLEPIITGIIKHLDFTKDKDLKLAHFALLIYPVSIWSYFFASRDKYEVNENARRFSITVPLMFFGEKLIEKPIYKAFAKLFKTELLKDKNTLSYNDILKLSGADKLKKLKAKNFAYGFTFLINTMAIAAAISILNRITTREQYLKDQKLQQNNKDCNVSKIYSDFMTLSKKPVS